MGVNIVCAVKIDRKHDLLTICPSRGQKQNATKPLMSRAWGCWRRFLTDFSDVINIWWRQKAVICRQMSSVLLTWPFYSFKAKIFVINWKSPVANIRKMLLMKDRSFLYELRAYLIYVKVGEICQKKKQMLWPLNRTVSARHTTELCYPVLSGDLKLYWSKASLEPSLSSNVVSAIFRNGEASMTSFVLLWTTKLSIHEFTLTVTTLL